jgi:hypothetical protein
LGSFFIQFGGLFRPSSVKLVARVVTNSLLFGASSGVGTLTETLQLQPEVIPAVDQDFTFGGKCTVTSSQFGQSIVGHSCLYDLCLGSSTDCIFVYAGTRFDFAPIPRARGPTVNVQNKGLLDPTDVGSDQKTPLQPDVAFSLRSALPPSFPGFVFGGVGNYEGIKGSFDLITVAQRSLNPQVDTAATVPPTAAPTLTDAPTPDFQNGRDLHEEENKEERTATTKDDVTTESSSNNDAEEEKGDNEEQQERDLQRDSIDIFDDDENVIVQKIFLVTNIRLPLGPKAI